MSVSPIKSAVRVLQVLELFQRERQPCQLKDICTALGYPQSSTSVLLASLRDAGYFDHDSLTGLYTPNVRLALMTAWVEEHLYSDQSLMRLMHGVHDACGHTVSIAKLQGANLVAAAQQFIEQGGADKAGSADEGDFHERSPWGRRVVEILPAS